MNGSFLNVFTVAVEKISKASNLFFQHINLKVKTVICKSTD